MDAASPYPSDSQPPAPHSVNFRLDPPRVSSSAISNGPFSDRVFSPQLPRARVS